MKRTITFFTLLFCLASTAVHAEEMTISAGLPLLSVLNPVKAGFEKATGIKVNMLYGSATLVYMQLKAGESDGACFGDTFEGAIGTLKKEGAIISDPSIFKHVLIAKGHIHTVVNKANPVKKLSKDQLKGIFTGKITNWNEVGGNNEPIMVVLSSNTQVMNNVYSKTVMDKEPFLKEVLEMEKLNDIQIGVETNSGAIAFGTSLILATELKRIETPEISRPVTLVTKGEPSAKISKFIDFILNGAGKSLIKE